MSQSAEVPASCHLIDVAYFNMLLGIYGTVGYALRIVNLPKSLNAPQTIAAQWVFAVGIIISVIVLFLGLLLLRGAKQGRIGLCQIWIYSQSVVILHSVVQIIGALGGVGKQEEDTTDVFYNILFILVQFYFLSTVIKIVGEMKRGESYNNV